MDHESTSSVKASPVRPPSFRTVYDAGFDYVWRNLQRLGVHEADLEDVTHDVFIVIYRNLSDYDPTRPLEPWLFGTALRVASDYRRRARHRREVPGNLDLEVIDEAAPPDQRIASKEDQQIVIEALHSLNLEQRAVLSMFDIEGHSMPEIAQALAIPLNTAYSRLRLAREHFKAAVQRLLLRRGTP